MNARIGAYRVLLRLLPRDFRERYADDMEGTFRDRTEQGLSLTQTAFEFWNLFVVVVQEHRAARRARRGQTSPPRPALAGFDDVRRTLRSLARRPGYTVVVIATLALAIGANTAIYSLVEGIVLSPLPYNTPERIGTVWSVDIRRGGVNSRVTLPNHRDVAERVESFDAMAALGQAAFRYDTPDGDVENLPGAWITANFFQALGVAPQMGRGFRPEENAAGAAVAIVSHTLWRTDFHADPEILGQSIILNDTAFTIVGVMPDVPIPLDVPSTGRLRLNESQRAVWRPFDFTWGCAASRGCAVYGSIARLRDGVTFAEAQSELDATVTALGASTGQTNLAVRITPMLDEVAGWLRPALFALLTAVALILLLACANLANLGLTHAASREREFALRTALGAGSWRLARPLLIENLVLAIVGGGLGILLAYTSLSGLLSLYAGDLPRRAEIDIDGTVLGFSILVSVSTGLFLSIIPALRASRTDPRDALVASSRSATLDRRGLLVRSTLVAGQMALVMMIVVGAGLVAKSFSQVLAIDVGFDRHDVTVAEFELPLRGFETPEPVIAFTEQLRERIASTPGVRDVAVSYDHPLESNWFFGFGVEGATDPNTARGTGRYRPVGPDYLKTLGIALRTGREFTTADRIGAPPVVMVNETFARQFIEGQPIGRRISMRQPQMSWGEEMPTSFEIVGVVSDVKFLGVEEAVEPAVYVPWTQVPQYLLTLYVRTVGPTPELAATIRATAHGLNPRVPGPSFTTLEALYVEAVAGHRFNVLMLGGFGALALLLASVGVYGVVSYNTRQRASEVGIRIALGATPARVTGHMFRQGIRVVLTGLMVGVVGSLIGSRILSGLLYQVSATDPMVFAGTATLLLLIAAAAVYLPARQAARVHPREVLE